MFHQIISNTPFFVWVILGFLVYRGFMSSLDREVKIKRIVVIPVVMLILSLQGILTSFGGSPESLLAWLTALGMGIVFAWNRFQANQVRISPEARMVFLRGSWTPMLLMMAIFFLKYAVNVALVIHPPIRQDIVFMLVNCVLFGIFSGIFLGNMARILHLYKQANNNATLIAA